MHDTVILAKLADPASAGSDASGLKQLAAAVLGDKAQSPPADRARAELFRAGRWLTDIDATTPVQRSGWAQADAACETMVRYAASDVIDTAALAIAPRLPRPCRARAGTGHTADLRPRNLPRPAHRRRPRATPDSSPSTPRPRVQAAAKVRACGVASPGSAQQVASALSSALGVTLPLTPTGRSSAAESALTPMREADGPAGELIRAVLDYRDHDTILGTFLNPYAQLARHGDGRARPTVYTLGTDTGRMSLRPAQPPADPARRRHPRLHHCRPRPAAHLR